jgi:hypothetical protein
MANKYYTLKEIWKQMDEFLTNNPDVYNNDEGQTEEVWDEFDKLQDEIFSDNQTYFQWVDCDCFDLAEAFDSVLEYLKTNKKILKDYLVEWNDDHLYVLVETEN